MLNNCYNCKHHKTVPGNCHIQCVKPDVNMTGNLHGISHGWFYYPLIFDPIWATSKCKNYDPIDETIK